MKTGIFSLISRQRLQNVLETLHAYTELTLELLDAEGNLLMAFGDPPRHCMLMRIHVFRHNECAELKRKAGERAKQLGEAYIFTCPANLNCISFPLQYQDELLGCILVGPFLMDKPDSTLVSSMLERYPLTPALALEMYDELESLKVIAPTRVKHLSKLIDHLLSPLLESERALMLKTQEKLYQQSRINETIQMYKEQGTSPSQSYLYEKETALLTKVRTGNIAEVKALLNDLLGYVLFSEGGNLDAVRTRAIELTTLLSRVAMDGGARADSIYELNGKFLALMAQGESIDDLCYLLQDVAESFMSAMFSTMDKGNAHIRHALRYMAANYAEPLTLETVAHEVGLSPNYLSKLFQESVGVGFREQLNRIRIEESKQLLLNTDYSLADIALAMGFVDQSYFCKVFKRIVGLTPGKFRA